MMYGLITILWINGSGDEEGLNTIMETVKYDLRNFPPMEFIGNS